MQQINGPKAHSHCEDTSRSEQALCLATADRLFEAFHRVLLFQKSCQNAEPLKKSRRLARAAMDAVAVAERAIPSLPEWIVDDNTRELARAIETGTRPALIHLASIVRRGTLAMPIEADLDTLYNAQLRLRCRVFVSADNSSARRQPARPTPTEERVWTALAGRSLDGKELKQHAQIGSVGAVRNVVGAMNRKKPGCIVNEKDGRGYWRPDAPPPPDGGKKRRVYRRVRTS